MDKAAKLISDSIIGADYTIIYIKGKAYPIMPPTIRRIAGATSCLSNLNIAEDSKMRDILLSCKDVGMYATALSWFIKGDASLTDELLDAELEEVVDGLCAAFNLISIDPFLNAVNLMKTASLLTAIQSPK